jgi:hypothetical protein
MSSMSFFDWCEILATGFLRAGDLAGHDRTALARDAPVRSAVAISVVFGGGASAGEASNWKIAGSVRDDD